MNILVDKLLYWENAPSASTINYLHFYCLQTNKSILNIETNNLNISYTFFDTPPNNIWQKNLFFYYKKTFVNLLIKISFYNLFKIVRLFSHLINYEPKYSPLSLKDSSKPSQTLPTTANTATNIKVNDILHNGNANCENY